MKGVRFGYYHSYSDLNMILSKKEIGSPPIKANRVDVEGSDGSIDFTDFFGGPVYGDRVHRFTFSTEHKRLEYLAHYSAVVNAIHGQKMQIVLDDDKDYFYIGRCDVSGYTNEKGIGTIVVECTCDPWKYRQEVTSVTADVSETAMLVLHNGGHMRVSPEVTATASMQVALGENAWTVPEGESSLPELELLPGDSTIVVQGSGTITFTWREGEL